MALRKVIVPSCRVIFLAAAAAAWSAAAAASSMRCEGGVVRVGDSEDTVLARCGEPDWRTEFQRELLAAQVHGKGRDIRVVDVKTWTYRRGYGKFILLLTFEGGLMTRVDRGPRQDTR